MRAICIASGPSLTQDDVEYCRGNGKIFAVNDCHRLAPWADVLYACDGHWWDHYKGVPEFQGKKWTLDIHAAAKYGLNLIGTCEDKWSNNPACIAKGGNSGFQALNLAILKGATEVILLGYDMKLSDDGKRHWFGDHPTDSMNLDSEYWRWILYFREAAPLIPVPVINCTVDSALDCFPRARLRDVI